MNADGLDGSPAGSWCCCCQCITCHVFASDLGLTTHLLTDAGSLAWPRLRDASSSCQPSGQHKQSALILLMPVMQAAPQAAPPQAAPPQAAPPQAAPPQAAVAPAVSRVSSMLMWRRIVSQETTLKNGGEHHHTTNGAGGGDEKERVLANHIGWRTCLGRTEGEGDNRMLGQEVTDVMIVRSVGRNKS
jgi:hypothetical protein